MAGLVTMRAGRNNGKQDASNRCEQEVSQQESISVVKREANGEKPLKYKKGAIAAISAYMAYTSRSNKFELSVPDDDERALAAFQRSGNTSTG